MFKFFRKRQQPAPSPAMQKLAADINAACIPLAAAIAARAAAHAPPNPQKRKTMWPFDIPKKRREQRAREEEALARRNAAIEKVMRESVARHQAMQLRALDQRNTEWFKQGASGD